MKHFKIKMNYLILILILGTSFSFCTNNKNAKNYIIDQSPRKPKNEIPVIYDFSWQVYQSSLDVDSLKVKVIESNLTMFNDKSLISYTVYGQINSTKNSVAKIGNVHLSERVNNDSTVKCDGIIEITPIVFMDVEQNALQKKVKFRFTNEMIVNSIHWGNNEIKFNWLK